MRRMDRYKDENEDITPTRSDKNKDLYQNIGTNSRYANFSDITSDINNANAFDLNAAKENYNTREAYQQIKEYENVMPKPKIKKELDEFNYFYKNKENRIYDINSVLEEARKNRVEKDQLDEKRKLKNNDYNILSSVNKEELEKYKKERVERPKTIPEDDIKELIDTITSKTLAGEIDKATTVNLLSDLMATNILDSIDKDEQTPETSPTVPEESSHTAPKYDKTIEENNPKKIKGTIKKDSTNELKGLAGADTDFYTRSMDLSEKDFNFNDDNGKKMPFILKLFLTLIIIAIIAVATYYIYKII